MTCRNNWDVVEVGGGCSVGGAGRAYTCCEPSMVGLIVVIVVFAVIVLGTILGIVLCCVYCKCCKECCGIKNESRRPKNELPAMARRTKRPKNIGASFRFMGESNAADASSGNATQATTVHV